MAPDAKGKSARSPHALRDARRAKVTPELAARLGAEALVVHNGSQELVLAPEGLVPVEAVLDLGDERLVLPEVRMLKTKKTHAAPYFLASDGTPRGTSLGDTWVQDAMAFGERALLVVSAGSEDTRRQLALLEADGTLTRGPSFRGFHVSLGGAWPSVGRCVVSAGEGLERGAFEVTVPGWKKKPYGSFSAVERPFASTGAGDLAFAQRASIEELICIDPSGRPRVVCNLTTAHSPALRAHDVLAASDDTLLACFRLPAGGHELARVRFGEDDAAIARFKSQPRVQRWRSAPGALYLINRHVMQVGLDGSRRELARVDPALEIDDFKTGESAWAVLANASGEARLLLGSASSAVVEHTLGPRLHGARPSDPFHYLNFTPAAPPP